MISDDSVKTNFVRPGFVRDGQDSVVGTATRYGQCIAMFTATHNTLYCDHLLLGNQFRPYMGHHQAITQEHVCIQKLRTIRLNLVSVHMLALVQWHDDDPYSGSKLVA